MERTNNNLSISTSRNINNPNSNQTQPSPDSTQAQPATGHRDSMTSLRTPSDLNGPSLTPQTAPIENEAETPESIQSQEEKPKGHRRAVSALSRNAQPAMRRDPIFILPNNNPNMSSNSRISSNPNRTLRITSRNQLNRILEEHVDDQRSPSDSSRGSQGSITSIYMRRSPSPYSPSKRRSQTRIIGAKLLQENAELKGKNAKLEGRVEKLEKMLEEQTALLQQLLRGMNQANNSSPSELTGKWQKLNMNQNENADAAKKTESLVQQDLNSNEPKAQKAPLESEDQNETSFFDKVLARRQADLENLGRGQQHTSSQRVSRAHSVITTASEESNFGDLSSMGDSFSFDNVRSPRESFAFDQEQIEEVMENRAQDRESEADEASD